MFQCDGMDFFNLTFIDCKGWYHPTCMGMSPEEAEMHRISKEAWICPFCLTSVSILDVLFIAESYARPLYSIVIKIPIIIFLL